MVFEKQLTEQLRPTTLNNIILLDRVSQSMGTEGEINDNMIFAGHAGIGKCVSGDTIVEIKDKLTGKICLMKIKDLL